MNAPEKKTKRGPAAMSDEHKAALAKGRAEGRAVKAYLDALVANKPKRGRKRTKESIAKRLEKIEAELASAAPVQQLQLIQERLDLTAEAAAMDESIDMTALEDDFVGVAADYSARKGISWTAWREIGVDAAVLKRAGVPRTRSS